MKPNYVKAKLDSVHTGKYVPFTFFGLVNVIGMMLLYSFVLKWNLPYWAKPAFLSFFLISLITDIILFYWMMPSGQLHLQQGYKGATLKIEEDGLTLFSGEVVDFSYWWGYYYPPRLEVDDYGELVTVPGGGTSEHNLFLELTNESGQKVTLYEMTNPWESTPVSWPYEIRNIDPEGLVLGTFKLFKIVDLLSSDGMV